MAVQKTRSMLVSAQLSRAPQARYTPDVSEQAASSFWSRAVRMPSLVMVGNAVVHDWLLLALRDRLPLLVVLQVAQLVKVLRGRGERSFGECRPLCSPMVAR